MFKPEYLSDYSSELFSCLDYQAKTNANKSTHERSHKNIPDLEEPCPIFISTKANKITRVLIIYVSKFYPGFMLQIYLSFFGVERICGFNSTFLAKYSDTSYLFGFLYIIKLPLLDVLKFLVT